MNQSETSAAAAPLTASTTIAGRNGSAGPRVLAGGLLARLVRVEVVPDPQAVDGEQHDRADDRDRHLVPARAVADLVGEAEQDDDPDREQEQRRRVLRQPRPEPHRPRRTRAREPAMITRPSTSSPFANSEPRIEVRATTISPADEREQHDEELRQVAERRLERARDRRAVALADRLGRDRDRPGEPAERDRGDDEDDDRLDVREVEDAGEHRERHDGREDEGRPAHRAILSRRGAEALPRSGAAREDERDAAPQRVRQVRAGRPLVARRRPRRPRRAARRSPPAARPGRSVKNSAQPCSVSSSSSMPLPKRRRTRSISGRRGARRGRRRRSRSGPSCRRAGRAARRARARARSPRR